MGLIPKSEMVSICMLTVGSRSVCWAHMFLFLSFISTFMGTHDPSNLTCIQLCGFLAQFNGIALHQHRRGHGSNPIEAS